MIRRFIAHLAIIVPLALASAPLARSYYVKPGGDDTLDGTSLAKAWNTPQVAADRVEPGDTVRFQTGDYQNPPGSWVMKISRSGTAEKWIAFMAD